MFRVESDIVAALERIGQHSRGIGELIEAGEPDGPGSEQQDLRREIAREIDHLEARRATWPGDDPARAALEQAIRTHRELTWWNRHPEDEDYGADHQEGYDPSDAYDEAMADLCALLGAREAEAFFAERSRTSERLRSPAYRSPPSLAAIARELRELTTKLGARPWEHAAPGHLAANRRMEILGDMLRDVVTGIDASHPTRLPARRAARALWSLKHLRLSEAPAVWSEVERAVAALASVT